jgi:hypothetical protein
LHSTEWAFRFLDAQHRELEPTPKRLSEIASIESPTDPLPPVQENVAFDAKKPLRRRVARLAAAAGLSKA